ncbi:hypothetical protein GCM10022199_27260 [Marihabitans asiaticum]|uniref:ADP-ribose pyrophosphatase YjhB (NUDIX family) n=1 Tax=Marihabitans asiaticum TaxID=415218 RepID=A0A560WDC0_9MICO|nr:NUDIX domain-containing protein [Marihabitans asiaticum]TWD15534.1 ADP-ribose pyrophosphatase YjhB (NUDIX family) [Marihabitans asiaticum]
MSVRVEIVRSGEVVAAQALPHGADPQLLCAHLGHPGARPLAARLVGSDLVLDYESSGEGVAGTTPFAVTEPRVEDQTPGAARRVQRPAAYAVVVADDQVLLTRLSERVRSAAGRWMLPGGGIDAGESPVEAVLREVEEETAQHVEVAELAMVQSDHWVGESPRGEVEDFHALRLIYRASCPEPTPARVLESKGSTGSAQWVTISPRAPEPSTWMLRQAWPIVLG